MAKRINWQPIKDEYITGTEKDGNIFYPSLYELATKYKISVDNLKHKAARESWREQRQIFNTKLTHKKHQAKIDAISERGVKLDILHFEIAENISRQLKKIVKEEPSLSKLNLLAAVALKAQELGKKALGENNSAADGQALADFIMDLMEGVNDNSN